MKLETYQLKHSQCATLTVYLHNIVEELGDKLRPIIFIIPGGGYEMVSEREAEPIAIAFYHAGYHAAILRYSTNENARDMQPMIEAFEAIKLIRENAKDWRILPNKIATCGFSAGGHLAAACGTMWNEPKLISKLNDSRDIFRPDAMILSYPVISSGEYAHRGSFYELTGSREEDENTQFYSLDRRVDEDTPQTFIWHTWDDDCVPVENTLLMINALRKSKVSCECHIFNQGEHGLSLCSEEVNSVNEHAGKWFSLCIEWLKAIGFIIEG